MFEYYNWDKIYNKENEPKSLVLIVKILQKFQLMFFIIFFI